MNADQGVDLSSSSSATKAPITTRTQLALESALVESRELVESDLGITVLEADGDPITRGSVVLARDGIGLAVEACSADGVACFDGHPGPIEVLALCGTWVRGKWSLEHGMGKHTFVLSVATGAHGILLVDGAPPGRCVDLTWSTDPNYREVKEAPTFVFTSFRWPGQRGAPSFAVRTAADGRFHVAGLPRDWVGRIALPVEYQTLAGEGDFAVGGVGDLVLRATWRPAIRGRAVSVASGVPVRQAAVRHEAACAGGAFSGIVESLEDGTFRIPITCGPIESFRLRLTADGLVSDSVVLGAVPAVGIDLGDVALHASRTASLRVLDERGLPVQGAIAVIGEDPLDCSGLSDSEGRLALPYLSPGLDLLAVHALGHRPAMVSASALLAESTEVRLQRVHLLGVEVAGPAAGAAGATLVLSTEALDAFEVPDADIPDSFQTELGASAAIQRIRSSDAGLRQAYPCLERIMIAGLRPGIGLELEVLGTDGSRVSERVPVQIGEPGLQVVHIDTHGQAFVVPLLVTDEAGEPVFQVNVSGPSAIGTLARTRLDGTAEVSGVFSRGAAFILQRRGYLTQELLLSDLVLAPAGARNRVVLRSAASFRVTAQTETGATADAEWVEVHHEGRKVGRSRRIDLGTFEVESVPDEPLLVRLGLGGNVFEQQISEPMDTKISVPVYSPVKVNWNGGALDSERWYVLDFDPIAADSLGMRRAARGEEWTQGVTLPAVFPGTYRACLVDPQGRSHTGPVAQITLGCAGLQVGDEFVTLTLTDG